MDVWEWIDGVRVLSMCMYVLWLWFNCVSGPRHMASSCSSGCSGTYANTKTHTHTQWPVSENWHAEQNRALGDVCYCASRLTINKKNVIDDDQMPHKDRNILQIQDILLLLTRVRISYGYSNLLCVHMSDRTTVYCPKVLHEFHRIAVSAENTSVVTAVFFFSSFNHSPNSHWFREALFTT